MSRDKIHGESWSSPYRHFEYREEPGDEVNSHIDAKRCHFPYPLGGYLGFICCHTLIDFYLQGHGIKMVLVRYVTSFDNFSVLRYICSFIQTEQTIIAFYVELKFFISPYF